MIRGTEVDNKFWIAGDCFIHFSAKLKSAIWIIFAIIVCNSVRFFRAEAYDVSEIIENFHVKYDFSNTFCVFTTFTFFCADLVVISSKIVFIIGITLHIYLRIDETLLDVSSCRCLCLLPTQTYPPLNPFLTLSYFSQWSLNSLLYFFEI